MELTELYNNACRHYDYTNNIIAFILTHTSGERELTKVEIDEIVDFVFKNKFK